MRALAIIFLSGVLALSASDAFMGSGIGPARWRSLSRPNGWNSRPWTLWRSRSPWALWWCCGSRPLRRNCGSRPRIWWGCLLWRVSSLRWRCSGGRGWSGCRCGCGFDLLLFATLLPTGTLLPALVVRGLLGTALAIGFVILLLSHAFGLKFNSIRYNTC
jgi:hypothetical protein